ncbi:MAG: DEAD/DEAH box helicase [Labilithrix sp.]|nr:DEAD/DEAH box helicase [Labilithrix sp.]MCW5815683.1 DEAD/DEAH box helicase [Labilithrix sp.]
MTALPSHALSMRDRLSHLSFDEARRLLGPEGKRLILAGGALAAPPPEALTIGDAEARLVWEPEPRGVITSLHLDPASKGRLRLACSRCRKPCAHGGGMLSTLLEQKSDLGLAAPPPEPVRHGSEEKVIAAELAERAERAKKERMRIRSADAGAPWTDYEVTSAVSGKTYRVALRGTSRGESYCSCPDFKINTLGTCKHVMKVLAHATKRFDPSVRAKPYVRRRITVHLRYDDGAELAIALPKKLSDEASAILQPLLRRRPNGNGSANGAIDAQALVRCLARLEAAGVAFFVTPDAEELVQRRLLAARMAQLIAEIRRAPAEHPLRKTLLKETLLPYQLDGIAFAAGAGRAILADEMGLGKTIQGVGVAELLAREAGISKVLIVCPASLKSQWRSEIERFSGRSAALVTGPAKERAAAYAGSQFFTICNYEQVLKDILHIEKSRWDLIVLDEGQRIKNWEAKTSRVIKGLTSRFALVLSGTPLENRLDDLHSVAAFVDPHRLGPAFRFLHRHHRRDEEGKLVGFKNLDDLRARIAPILLRRTRESVRLELPPRTVEIVRVPPTAEQAELHDAHLRVVAQIVRKPYLTEMDLLRLRSALLMCRMAANSTFLVDKEPPGWSTKLERLGELFDAVAAEPDRKVVLFSEWTTMLDLIEPLLAKRKLRFVRLDGSVPQRKRQEIVAAFQSDAKTRVFLTTNAGSSGLNLQAANTVINVDLPWNPAVLEQRIARAHRMGQSRPVAVFVLVTEQTIEENLLTTLSSKRELALAALDADSAITDVDVRRQADDLKEKLEVLLGAKPEAPVDETVKASAAGAVAADRIATTGGAFVRAALDLLGELTGAPSGAGADALLADVRKGFDVKVTPDEHGTPRLSIAMPSREDLGRLFQGVARLLLGGTPPPPTQAIAAITQPAPTTRHRNMN